MIADLNAVGIEDVHHDIPRPRPCRTRILISSPGPAPRHAAGALPSVTAAIPTLIEGKRLASRLTEVRPWRASAVPLAI